MPSNLDPHVLVIFGASGDLAQRKLVPAVFELFRGGYLPEKFALLGASRTDFTDEAFRNKVIFENEHFKSDGAKEEEIKAFSEKLFYQDLATYDGEKDIKALADRLKKLDKELGVGRNYIFYLSTPPKLYSTIPAALAKAGLNNNQDAWARLIVEKPFGYNEQSAIKLNREIQEHFPENTIYRIDHYLGKETVQNLLVTRFANGFFEPLWNRNYVQSVQITAAETVGVGSRGGYYDESGAMRDMVQNHLLQVLAHVAMEPPIRADAPSIRNEKLKLFQSLRPITKKDVKTHVVRGQYTEGITSEGKEVAYRDSPGVPEKSKTETYVAMKFFIDNWRWAGVPFFVRTGKCLPLKLTEVVITFKNPPQAIFAEYDDYAMSCDNQLIIRIQPDEGMALEFGMKVPGEGFRVKNVDMDFFYRDLTKNDVPEAYTRLLLDCMKGEPTLYARGDSVEAAWAFVDPILEAWEKDEVPLYSYPAGSWGPLQADALWSGGLGNGWRNPTSSLTDRKHYTKQ
ncbi:glucose-6-phosphate dehydrogenase [Neolewinella lacunae]|uniref:Glucose-6-phosphate 1-dehydrogenase n=1 Tax=Neolewinella lacunae TaxID=1517758 RepID=A0A923TAB9_9BACT|nr:glucose-6-phosphate dehydrogenase [Neolewinella lacunae]MBC6996371.1 glucose-6-phosphate dehydrogenase [Neolewinella lacunae]MDN3636994.1 glucose-6-phosphate dehydrogenase [Neolewinella lacunae]